MTTDFEVGNYHRKRGQGELRLSRLKWKDKIYRAIQRVCNFIVRALLLKAANSLNIPVMQACLFKHFLVVRCSELLPATFLSQNP